MIRQILKEENFYTQNLMSVLYEISHGKWPQKKGNYGERIEWLQNKLAHAQNLSLEEECEPLLGVINGRIFETFEALEASPNSMTARCDGARTSIRYIIKDLVAHFKNQSTVTK